MRRRILMVLAAVTLPVAGACGGSSSSATQNAASVAQAGTAGKTDKAADEAALRATYQKMPAQMMSGDASGMAAGFADDGIEITPGMTPAQGPTAVAKELTSMLATMKNFKIEMIGDPVITVADAGDLAVVKAPYRMSYSDAKGKKAEDHGTSMTVFRKVNGQWKILYDTNISEVAAKE